MNLKRMLQKAEGYGITLSPEMLEKCFQYSELIQEWNQKSNITGITEAEEVENKHFIDSLFLASQPEVTGRVADIGTGAGFPGMVLKIYRPDIKIVLIESNKKKIAFLKHAAEQLKLEVELSDSRAEDLAKGSKRECFDLVTARAVAAMPILVEYCLPLVKLGGYFIPMKGRLDEEVQEAKNAINTLGGLLKEERAYQLPDGSERKLYLIEKVKQTDTKYPRHTGRIKKNPL